MNGQDSDAGETESEALAKLMGQRMELGFALSAFASELQGKAQHDES